MLDEMIMSLLKLKDLPEAERFVDGKANFSISFLEEVYDDNSFFLRKFPIVTDKFYLGSYDLEAVQEEKSALYGKELARITAKETKKKRLLVVICIGLFILTIVSFYFKAMLGVLSLGLFGMLIMKFFNNWKDEKQHTYRLLEIIYHKLNVNDKRLFLSELKKSDLIKLENPTDSMKSSCKRVDFINGSIMLKSSEVIKFFYNEILSEKAK